MRMAFNEEDANLHLTTADDRDEVRMRPSEEISMN